MSHANVASSPVMRASLEATLSEDHSAIVHNGQKIEKPS